MSYFAVENEGEQKVELGSIRQLAIGCNWQLGKPQSKMQTLDGQRTKNSGFDVIRGQFDAIGDWFNAEFLGSNEISPLES